MTYQQTLDWLFSQLPMYQRTGGANYKIDLEKTHALMRLLDHPENGFKSIHVAGTNGKGSVSHLMASALQQQGFKVGLYTSPHLKDFRERIKINGKMISEEEVILFVQENKNKFTELQLSFFEMTVGMAFSYFTKEKVDIAVVEVGMGGRLDSTNVLHPLVSVITNISLDHTQFLGTTLEQIAKEKGGIIKPNVPVIIGRTQPETTDVFVELGKKNNAPVWFADQLSPISIKSDLTGMYQKENIATAFYALNQLPLELKPTNLSIEKGFAQVKKNTGLMGRWQILQDTPLTICDTGHNEDGIKQVLNQINQTPHEKLHLVWGMVNDKNITAILSLLPKKASYYFCKPDLPRGLSPEALAEQALNVGLKGNSYSSVKKALNAAQHAASARVPNIGIRGRWRPKAD